MRDRARRYGSVPGRECDQAGDADSDCDSTQDCQIANEPVPAMDSRPIAEEIVHHRDLRRAEEQHPNARSDRPTPNGTAPPNAPPRHTVQNALGQRHQEKKPGERMEHTRKQHPKPCLANRRDPARIDRMEELRDRTQRNRQEDECQRSEAMTKKRPQLDHCQRADLKTGWPLLRRNSAILNRLMQKQWFADNAIGSLEYSAREAVRREYDR